VKIPIIYEDNDIIVINKPAGILVHPTSKGEKNTLIDYFPRAKLVHRLDKDTSGILLIAKDDRTLNFLQKQFQERKVKKKYLALVVGNLKSKKGEIKTLLGRSPKDRRKQKVFLPKDPGAEGKREAVTKYEVLQSYENYDLIEAEPLTGRKHQIRAHFAYLSHPIAGDKLYSFKSQLCPKGLKRQFLHANYLKVQLPSEKTKEFKSDLPEELKLCLQKLKTSSTLN